MVYLNLISIPINAFMVGVTASAGDTNWAVVFTVIAMFNMFPVALGLARDEQSESPSL